MTDEISITFKNGKSISFSCKYTDTDLYSHDCTDHHTDLPTWSDGYKHIWDCDRWSWTWQDSKEDYRNLRDKIKAACPEALYRYDEEENHRQVIISLYPDQIEKAELGW